MLDHSVAFNLVAQERVDRSELFTWFDSLPDEEKLESLVGCSLAVDQSHPTKQEIDLAIQDPFLKPTYTPCVLFKKYIYREAIRRCCDLPPNEATKVYRLFVAVFSIADKRRRQSCGSECHHSWHNISDEEVALVKSQLSQYSSG